MLLRKQNKIPLNSGPQRDGDFDISLINVIERKSICQISQLIQPETLLSWCIGMGCFKVQY